MCNFGTRPTFEDNDLVMEVNIFHNFSNDLYGNDIMINFLDKIRNEAIFLRQRVKESII